MNTLVRIMNTPQTKTALRARLKELRRGITQEMRLNHGKTIQEHFFALPRVAAGRVFFVYVSHANEVDTHGIISRLRVMERDISIPHIVDRHCMRAVQFNAWTDLEPGPLGILTPRDPSIRGRKARWKKPREYALNSNVRVT